jgi:hypothetical protein
MENKGAKPKCVSEGIYGMVKKIHRTCKHLPEFFD